MRVLKQAVAVSAILLLSGFALAQEAMEAPKPTAEHKALEWWLGSWAGEGEMKPGPFGEGGPMKWTEECSWFADSGFHIVCKSKGDGPMGPMKGLGIIGYNPEKKVYTHYGIDSSGWTGHAEGTLSGDAWTFQSEETMEGKTFHTRYTMTKKSDTVMTFSWDMSEDGKNWMTLMDGKTTKQ